MKKILVAIAAALVAQTASATIAGSSHDLTAAGNTYGGGGATCAYCHMPHNGQAVAGAPLWARNLPTGTGYTWFTSTSGGQASPSSLGAGSAVCLSCHDGTIAPSTVLKIGAGATGNTQVAGSTKTATLSSAGSPALVGPNLSNDHPISIVYSTSGTNPGGLSASPPTVFGITTPGTTKIECTSCHNAHNSTYNANVTVGGTRQGASGFPARQFMVSYATSTDFCGACHALK